MPLISIMSVSVERGIARDNPLGERRGQARSVRPRCFQWIDALQSGGSMSYSKPVNLPVELPTKFELAINLKTAKELGIAAPQALPVATDGVIE